MGITADSDPHKGTESSSALSQVFLNEPRNDVIQLMHLFIEL